MMTATDFFTALTELELSCPPGGTQGTIEFSLFGLERDDHWSIHLGAKQCTVEHAAAKSPGLVVFSDADTLAALVRNGTPPQLDYDGDLSLLQSLLSAIDMRTEVGRG